MPLPTKPCLSEDELATRIPEGSSIMVGGFMGVGTPNRLVAALARQGRGGFTLICNDAGREGLPGIAPLIAAGLVSRLITSHIGLNPLAQQLMIEGRMAVELNPQGTLVERIRAAGAGLGGFLTPTGVGTLVAEGKRVIEVDGQDYLLELPLRADFALLGCQHADHLGNLDYSLTATNFNPVMAMAADTVMAEPEVLVPVGVLSPDSIRTPSVLVDYLVARARPHQERSA